MEIPYTKVLIYALTFACYAWSGLGSSALTTLRDAVLAAESVFGDFVRNIASVADKFRVVHDVFDAAVEENCIYSCPDGQKPVKNKNHAPSGDGCGSLGIQIASEYLPIDEMTSCCNDHDKCYDTCNSDKELCDVEFKRCLYNYCDSYQNTVTGQAFVKGCKAAAKLLFTGTLTLGCKAYLDAQEKACYCSAKNKYKKYKMGAGEL